MFDSHGMKISRPFLKGLNMETLSCNLWLAQFIGEGDINFVAFRFNHTFSNSNP